MSTRVKEMDEPICHIEISKEDDEIVARIQSDLGGIREFRSHSFEHTLKLIVNELQEELEFANESGAE